MTVSTTAARRQRRAAAGVSSPWAMFLKGFVKHPVMVGSIVPSSVKLIRKMLGPVDWENTKLFVEYGPGVGTFCRHILERMAPDVVLMDLGNPSRDTLEEMLVISRALAKPIAMFVDQSDDSMIGAAIDAGISAYVVDGLRKERVKPILDLAIRRFNAFARMQSELDDARTQLADRKTIDRAKAIIMAQRGLSEPDAYALLRTSAMNQGKKMVEVAAALITASDLLGGPL